MKYNRSFCIKMDVPNMPLSRIERLKSVFSSLAKEVFGKRIESATVKALQVNHICKFFIEMKEEAYDPAFICIAIMNLADASVALSYFKEGIYMPHESKRMAKMCFALYMDRNRVEMNKIKTEYAEIPICGCSMQGDSF